MKICIDLTSLYDKLSGIEKFTLMISKNMIIHDSKNKYILIFWNEINSDFLNMNDRKNIEFIVIKSKSKLLMSQVLLPMTLYKIKADRYLFMAFPSPLIFRNANIINTIHDMTPWLYPETMSMKGLLLFRILIVNAIRVSRSIVTVSNSSKNDILNKFKTDKPINVVYNGVDEIFNNFIYREDIYLKIKEKYRLNDNYILALGTLEPRKNFKLLLDAFVDLKKNGYLTDKLVVVGRQGWKYDNLLKDIDENILNDILFTGFIETSELPYIYKNAKLFVLPSLYEGFGIPTIEASSMRCIVLSSDIEVFKEVLQDNTIYFKSNDLKDLKNKIIEVMQYNETKIVKIKNNLFKNSIKYNWKNEAIKLLKIIEEKI